MDPNPGYRVYPDVVFDGETGLAMLFGGEWYDEDRRPQGDVGDMWAYQHIDRDK